MKRFANTHEWIEIKDGVATVGISQHAADEMNDLTYVELPEVGRKYTAKETFGSVESVKAASEIYSPITGTISEVNATLETDPEAVNRDAEGEGWICKYTDFDEASISATMTREEYLDSVK